MAICPESGCGLIAYPDHQYCLTHLKLRHHLSCGTVARLSAMEIFGTTAEELNKAKSISEFLAFDSLKDVELTLVFEELAGIEFDPEQTWASCDIVEVARQLEELLAAEKRFLVEPRLDVARAHKRAMEKKENVQRQVHKIVSSDLFRDYIAQLEYKEELLRNMLSVFVGGYWIEHVFTIPKLDREKLAYVHVFLLTAYGLVHVLLRPQEIQVQSWSTKQVSLKYTLAHDQGQTSKIVVEFIVGGDRKLFEFGDVEGIRGALRFYEKWLQKRNM